MASPLDARRASPEAARVNAVTRAAVVLKSWLQASTRLRGPCQSQSLLTPTRSSPLPLGRALAVLPLLLALAPCGFADSIGEHAAWIGGTHAADLAVSRMALANCSGCYEANPVLGSDRAVAVKVVGAGLAIGACWYFERKGKPHVARGIRWGTVAVNVLAMALSAKHLK